MKQAMYYERIEALKVHCYLCPHNCIIKPEGIGNCGARKNKNGDLFSLNYGKAASLSLDPIEKKPLNRFHPGSYILSVGTFGCNLKCSFCQNWNIAHEKPNTIDISPEVLVEKATQLTSQKNIGIAYTYNEPSIWYEFIYETSKLAKEKGLKNVLVTNGFITEEPLKKLLPYIDAMNIDVKAFTTKFYRDICKGNLSDIKKTLEIAAQACHIEVTTLIIPGLNDNISEIEDLCKWLSSISSQIPLHLSRFFPNYKMQDIYPTPKETLIKAKEKADEYLKYVYLGNV